MNYLVISPYYPQNFQQFSIQLAKQGVTVLGIGQEPYDQLDLPLKEALTEYFRVEDLENLDEIKRAVAFLFYKHGPIDRIESHNEYWLELDAALRSQFNVFGAKEEDLLKTKLKSQMKTYFQKAGVPVVPGQVVKEKSEIEAAVKKLGLPLIAKPDNGVGAVATYKLSSPADVQQFEAEWDQATPYFFETFVNSKQIVTFDGLVDAKGKIVFASSLVYTDTPMDILKNRSDVAYYNTIKMDPKLADYGQKIVETFGMRERFFHIEFFRDKDDYIAIEYNNRPAGGFITDAYNYAYSMDLFEQYARLVAGKAFQPSPYPAQMAVTVIRRDDKSYRYTDQELQERYPDQIKARLRMPDAFADLQGNDLYILTAESDHQVLDIIDNIRSLA